MIVPDVNVLIHAYNTDVPEHPAARRWWEQTLNGRRPVALSWASILGFLRLSTNRIVLASPLRPAEAIRHVRNWLVHPNTQIVTPGEEHAEILFGLIEHIGTAGNLTTDAHLAALAIEYQAEVATTDTDFARFPRLRWFNPLQTKP